jgi:SAM-dependent MidA family methyltransferase
MDVKNKINSHIKKNNYITIDEFMKIALSDSLDSYYINKDPIGETGDFITSPEISQMFGEIIGIWMIEKWIELGYPNKMNLVELGPGRGNLIKNLLNITKNIANFHNVLDVYLIEISNKLSEIQKKSLNDYNIKWSKEFCQMPDYPTIIIGNEFFDSLPIKQYIKFEDIWYERVITRNFSGNFEYDKIEINDLSIIENLNQYKSAQNDAIIEISIASMDYINLIKNNIGANKTYCLFIDYGYDIEPSIRQPNQYNSTLQAIKHHEYCDIFNDIGNCDLTSHVDFHRLSSFSRDSGFQTKPTISQKDFLTNYDIEHRLKILCKNKSTNLQNILHNQYNRLTSPKEMGNLFKVLEIISI